MKTYFKDFVQTALEKAWEYAAHRASFGHNVRFLRMQRAKEGGGTAIYYRVYFSSGICHPKSAIDVKDVPAEEKR